MAKTKINENKQKQVCIIRKNEIEYNKQMKAFSKTR